MEQPLANQTKVAVHADGGLCHGTPLMDGMCPKCGLIPDMQSVELWSSKDVGLSKLTINDLTRLREILLEVIAEGDVKHCDCALRVWHLYHSNGDVASAGRKDFCDMVQQRIMETSK